MRRADELGQRPRRSVNVIGSGHGQVVLNSRPDWWVRDLVLGQDPQVHAQAL